MPSLRHSVTRPWTSGADMFIANVLATARITNANEAALFVSAVMCAAATPSCISTSENSLTWDRLSAGRMLARNPCPIR